VSRRNPRGSSAAKRRKRVHDARTQRRGQYVPISASFYSAAYELGQQTAMTINKLIRIAAVDALKRGTP
jgi:hypothetical protein